MNARKSAGEDEEIKRIMATIPLDLRMAGLTPEQLLPVLPEEILRALSVEYLSRLPAETLAAVRKRLGQE